MTRRRRKWIIASALVGVVAAVVCWLGSGGGKLEVKLMFVGFTNDSTSGTKALVLATNSGSTTALLIAYGAGGLPGPLEPVSFSGFMGDVGVQRPTAGSPFPARLKPGETLLMSMSFTTLDKPMDACLLAERYDLKDRLYRRALDTCNGTLINLADKFMAAPPPEMVTLGPITNVPPESAASDPPRVARP